jgi:hypothetical protein
LVPWLFAVNVVLLEIGILSRRRELLRWTMAAPAGLLMLSTWAFAVPEPINLRPMLLDVCGCSPLFLTLAAVTALYALALLRRVPHAVHWLTAAMALFVVVGPATAGFHSPLALRAWPLAPLAAMQLFAAVRHRSGLHGLLTAVCGIAALCIAWPAIGSQWFGAVPAHLMLFAMLLVGAVFHDRAAQVLKAAAVLAISIACLFVLSGEAERWSIAPPVVLAIYPGFLFVLAAVYAYWVRARAYRMVPLLILAAWLMTLGKGGYRSLHAVVAGLDEIALGMACLLLGLMVSLWKLGQPQLWWRRLFEPPPRPVAPPGNARNGA